MGNQLTRILAAVALVALTTGAMQIGDGTVADPLAKVSTATLTKNGDATFSTIAGLVVPLAAGKTYNCRGSLAGTADASGGIKVQIAAASGLTATSVRLRAIAWNGTTPLSNTQVTSLGSNIVSATAVYTNIEIEGAIVVNAAGSLAVQAGQNASFAADTTVLVNSHFSCRRAA